MELAVPCAVAPADAAVGFCRSVWHHHIEPLIRLVCPGVTQAHQFAYRPIVGAVPGIAAGEAADRCRKPQRIGGAGIHAHPVSTDTHLNRVHIRIVTKVCGRRPRDLLTVAAEERGAVVKFHRLTIVIQTAEQITAEYACLAAAACRECQPCPEVDIRKAVILPCKLTAAVKLGVDALRGVFI
ncbi:hypothetical protein BW28_05835 [Clostridioides difficile]|nr:hypothetical protein BW28_05835 [Clostridioides difficile]